MTTCALIDDSGIFIGMVAAPEVPTDRYLTEITECDLPPGRYRWVAADAQFVPLSLEAMSAADGVPSLERVVFRLSAVMAEAGVSLPQEVVAWASWYQTTMEGS